LWHLSPLKVVITGLDPVIYAFWHADQQLAKTWMAGSSPAMAI
jgi:hypothetical protein